MVEVVGAESDAELTTGRSAAGYGSLSSSDPLAGDGSTDGKRPSEVGPVVAVAVVG